ncbi:hypothetical protein ACVI1T_001490 [Rhizobium redzepovicii]
MLYRVVRPFPLALDGLTLVDLATGDEREDFGGMEAGLEAEGYIELIGGKPKQVQPDAAPTAEPVKEIPQPEPRRRRGK